MQLKIIFKEHAIFEAKRRGISKNFIKEITANPRQKLSSKNCRIIFQSKYFDNFESKEMLIRIIEIESKDKFTVITVYKTSKIDKYWIKEGM